MGWPCFRSLLSFAGFSFSSSFESKHEKQPIPPNQIKKRFFFFFSPKKKKKTQMYPNSIYRFIFQSNYHPNPHHNSQHIQNSGSLSLSLRSAWERRREIGRKRRCPTRKDKASESKFHETPPTTITKRNR